MLRKVSGILSKWLIMAFSKKFTPAFIFEIFKIVLAFYQMHYRYKSNFITEPLWILWIFESLAYFVLAIFGLAFGQRGVVTFLTACT